MSPAMVRIAGRIAAQSPRNWIARPQRHIVAPAITWLNRSALAKGRKLTPALDKRTMANIVAIVAVPNAQTTANMPQKPPAAISIGIRTSQGPKTKMINNAQGVALAAVLLL